MSIMEIILNIYNKRNGDREHGLMSFSEILRTCTLDNKLINVAISETNFSPIIKIPSNLEKVLKLKKLVVQEYGDVQRELTLFYQRVKKKIRISLEYRDEIFPSWFMKNMMKNFCLFIQKFSKDNNLNKKVFQLNDIIPSDEYKSSCFYSYKHDEETIDSDAFSVMNSCFEKFSSYPAIVSYNGTKGEKSVKSYSYNDLKKMKEIIFQKISTYFEENKIEPNKEKILCIGVCMERRCELVSTILAIWDIGAVYVPLDIAQPEDRMKHIMEDCKCSLVICEEKTKSKMDFMDKKKIIVMNEKFFEEGGKTKLKSISRNDYYPDKNAYIIYTSGSTGKPKGVVIKMKGFVNTCREYIILSGLKEKDKYAWCVNISFDVSILEIFSSLLNGMTLYVVDKNTEMDSLEYYNFILENQINGCFIPPAILNYFPRLEDELENLKHILTGADNGTFSTMRFWSKKVQKFLHGYGPTECSIVTHFKKWSETENARNFGKCIRNMYSYIIFPNSVKLTPSGMIGELCIGGVGISKGYLNKNELNKIKFIRNPFLKNEMIYRTGDLCYVEKNGDVCFVGRKDNQVKIRGFRIELGEIESIIQKNNGVKEAIAFVDEKTVKGTKNISVAFILKKSYENHEKDIINKMKSELKKNLPYYMYPSFYYRFRNFPINLNGKIDMKEIRRLCENKEYEKKKYLSKEAENENESLESTLLMTLSQVIGKKKQEISINEEFFNMGANSIVLIKFHSMLPEKVKTNISVAEIFQNSSIKKLCSYIINKGEKINISMDIFKNKTSNSNGKVAIIGMSCKLPGADNIEEFFEVLKTNKVCCKEVNTNLEKKEKNYVPIDYPMNGYKHFDYSFFGISKEIAKIIDPQFRHVLELCYHCLEDAGYVSENDSLEKYSIGVFVSISDSVYHKILLDNLKKYQKQVIRDFNSSHFVAGFVSFYLNLTGPSVSINGACSSSAMSVMVAKGMLNSGELDLALVCGFTGTGFTEDGYYYEEGEVFSMDGKVRSFDEKSSGTVFTDGGACILLKPLQAAINDKDDVYSVIMGGYMNNDGKARDKPNLLSPSGNRQSELLSTAWKKVGINPEELSCIETHGSGTLIGDLIEIKSILQVLRMNNTQKKRFLNIGASKMNIGHTDSASGVVSIIKSSLSLKHKLIFGLPLLENVNKQIRDLMKEYGDFLVFPKESKKWTHNNKSKTRKIGVSSFGLGGQNVHLVLEDFKVKNELKTIKKEKVIMKFSSQTRESLINTLLSHYNYICQDEFKFDLNNYSFTLEKGRKEFKWRKSVAVESREKFKIQLEKLIDIMRKKENTDIAIKSQDNTVVAILFSGITSFSSYIGTSLFKNNFRFSQIITSTSKIVEEKLKTKFSFCENDDELLCYKELKMFVYQFSVAKLLLSYGVRIDFVLGLSFGEICSCVLAELISLEDAIILIKKRTELVQKTEKGVMILIKEKAESIKKIISGKKAEICLKNAPGVNVICCNEQNGKEIIKICHNNGIYSRILKDAHICFHSSRMNMICENLNNETKNFKHHQINTEIKMISSVNGKIYSKKKLEENHWTEHLRKKNKFLSSFTQLIDYVEEESLKRNKKMNILLIDICPSNDMIKLSSFFEKEMGEKIKNLCLRKINICNEEEEVFLDSLGKIWEFGLNVNLFEEKLKRIHLPLYPFEKKYCWYDMDFKKEDKENRKEQKKSEVDEEKKIKNDKTFDQVFRSLKNNVCELVKINLQSLEDKLKENPEIGFFQLGADSLLAMLFLSIIKQNYGVKFPMFDLYDEKKGSLRKIAETIVSDTTNLKNRKTRKEKTHDLKERKLLPLTSNQRSVYMIEAAINNKELYSYPVVIKLKGFSDLKLVRKSVYDIYSENRIFRCIFRLDKNSYPCQTWVDREKIEKVVKAFDHKSEYNGKKFYEKIVRDDLNGGFILNKSIFRAQVHKFNDCIIVFFNVHHLVVDYQSFKIISSLLWSKIMNTEQYFKVKYDYFDYINSIALNPYTKMDFWKEYLKNCSYELNFPFDKKSSQRDYSGKNVKLFIEKDLGYEEFLKEKKGSLLSLFLTSYCVVLHKLTKNNDFLVGVPFSNRSTNNSKIIGFLTNVLPLRIKCEYTTMLNELFFKIHEDLCKMTEFQEVPLEELIKMINEGKQKENKIGLGKTLVDTTFQIMSFEQRVIYDGVREEKKVNMKIKTQYEPSCAKFPIVVTGYESKKGIEFVFNYSDEMFSECLIKSMTNSFKFVLKQICQKRGNINIGEVDIICSEEKNKQIQEWSGVKSIDWKREEDNIISTFIEIASKYGDYTAIIHEKDKLTFNQLNMLSSLYAEVLKQKYSKYLRESAYVCVCIECSLEFVVVMMAIWKCGMIFVPFSRDWPKRRLKSIFEQTKCQVLITCEKFSIPKYKIKIYQGSIIEMFCLKSLQKELENTKFKENNHVKEYSSEKPAYVIFTSGTTGDPKGVIIPHSSVVTFVKDYSNEIIFPAIRSTFNGKLTNGNKFLNIFPHTFDGSLLEILPSILTGNTIVVVTNPKETDMNEILRVILEEKIFGVFFTPRYLTHFDHLKNNVDDVKKYLKIMCVGGDICPSHVMEFWGENIDNFYNIYGPTETTIVSHYKKWNKKKKNICCNIGKCLKNRCMLICDDEMNLLPLGFAGELLIGGKCLAKEYLNESELTSKKFVFFDFGEEYGKIRFYKTGDYVKFSHDNKGDILFMKRNDKQIKINGFRVELDAIKNVFLNNYQNLKYYGDCHVFFCGNKIHFVLLLKKPEIDYEEEERAIREKFLMLLPSWMVPSKIYFLDTFPMNNGKINYELLKKIVLHYYTKPKSSSNHEKNGSENSRSLEFRKTKKILFSPLGKIILKVLNKIMGKEKDWDFSGKKGKFVDSILAVKITSIFRNFGIFLNVRDVIESELVVWKMEELIRNRNRNINNSTFLNCEIQKRHSVKDYYNHKYKWEMKKEEFFCFLDLNCKKEKVSDKKKIRYRLVTREKEPIEVNSTKDSKLNNKENVKILIENKEVSLDLNLHDEFSVNKTIQYIHSKQNKKETKKIEENDNKSKKVNDIEGEVCEFGEFNEWRKFQDFGGFSNKNIIDSLMRIKFKEVYCDEKKLSENSTEKKKKIQEEEKSSFVPLCEKGESFNFDFEKEKEFFTMLEKEFKEVRILVDDSNNGYKFLELSKIFKKQIIKGMENFRLNIEEFLLLVVSIYLKEEDQRDYKEEKEKSKETKSVVFVGKNIRSGCEKEGFGDDFNFNFFGLNGIDFSDKFGKFNILFPLKYDIQKEVSHEKESVIQEDKKYQKKSFEIGMEILKIKREVRKQKINVNWVFEKEQNKILRKWKDKKKGKVILVKAHNNNNYSDININRSENVNKKLKNEKSKDVIIENESIKYFFDFVSVNGDLEFFSFALESLFLNDKLYLNVPSLLETTSLDAESTGFSKYYSLKKEKIWKFLEILIMVTKYLNEKDNFCLDLIDEYNFKVVKQIKFYVDFPIREDNLYFLDNKYRKDQLSERVESQDEKKRNIIIKYENILVPLITLEKREETKDNPPLFLIHAGFGFAGCYVKMCNEILEIMNSNKYNEYDNDGTEIQKKFEIYGINYPFVTDINKKFESFEEMCDFYIKIIEDILFAKFNSSDDEKKKKIMNMGIKVGGFSIGGNISFEICRRMKAKGWNIKLLVLIDSYVEITEQDDSFKTTINELEQFKKIPEVFLFQNVVNTLCNLYNQYIGELLENCEGKEKFKEKVVFIKSKEENENYEEIFTGWKELINWHSEKTRVVLTKGKHDRLISSENSRDFAEVIMQEM